MKYRKQVNNIYFLGQFIFKFSHLHKKNNQFSLNTLLKDNGIVASNDHCFSILLWSHSLATTR